MNYEQKYKEALERAKNLHKDAIDMGENIRAKQCEIIFHGLAESEDEKIRKAIHIYLDWLDGRKDYAPRGEYSIRDMIAWLEKQGEQKPYGQMEKCIDCQFNYAGECKGSCQMKRSERKPADKVELKFQYERGKVDAQKFSWSKENERIRKDLIGFFKDEAFLCHKREDIISWLEKQGEQKPITFNNDHVINSALNDYCCKQYNALHKENGGFLSFARLQHLAMDIYGWCKE